MLANIRGAPKNTQQEQHKLMEVQRIKKGVRGAKVDLRH